MNNKTLVKSQPKTVVETTYQISNFNLVYLKESLSGCVNSGLSSEAFLSYIDLSLLMTDLLAKRSAALKMLMEAYDIKPTTSGSNGMAATSYQYKGHEKAVEIEEKVQAINNQLVDLKPVNFVSKEEFFVFTSGRAQGVRKLLMDEVVTLAKVLMKQ